MSAKAVVKSEVGFSVVKSEGEVVRSYPTGSLVEGIFPIVRGVVIPNNRGRRSKLLATLERMSVASFDGEKWSGDSTLVRCHRSASHYVAGRHGMRVTCVSEGGGWLRVWRLA